ncbi:MAG: hypothetical protein OXI74_07095 [Rhodospirillaceae bacterium]|nr:hypothetical protein [Rhodospirillaceae bacterium]
MQPGELLAGQEAGEDGVPQAAAVSGAQEAAAARVAEPPETAAGGKEERVRLRLSW